MIHYQILNESLEAEKRKKLVQSGASSVNGQQRFMVIKTDEPR